MKEDRIITEKCQQCGEQYIPTRKGVQKFCSASCRSRHWSLKKNEKPKLTPQEFLDQAFEKQGQIKVKEEDKAPVSIDKMSLPGVGNAAAGVALVEGVIGIAKAFQPEHKKPATKGDIEELKQVINTRYLPIINYQDPFNRKAFYDRETSKIVLHNEQLNRMELPMI